MGAGTALPPAPEVEVAGGAGLLTLAMKWCFVQVALASGLLDDLEGLDWSQPHHP
jgi:hypothetical protein